MAYRELVLHDWVKVMNGGEHHGRFGEVVSLFSDGMFGVKIGRTDIVIFKEKSLMVAHMPHAFINDGKKDVQAELDYLEQRNKLQKSIRKSFDSFDPKAYDDDDQDEEDELEACGECSCCKWHNNNY